MAALRPHSPPSSRYVATHDSASLSECPYNLHSQHMAMQAVEFYKTWGEWGSLANFSPHPILMPGGQGDQLPAGTPAAMRSWPTVEHYYQAQKFAGTQAACSCWHC